MSLEQTFSVVLQNTKLSLSKAGNGEPVLCLHGNPGSKYSFTEMMKKLDGTNIKLMALDRPGHNSSEELIGDKKDLWHDTSVYSELIDKELNGKAWLLGHSYGCLTALKIAIKHPENVKGIIMINPMIVPDKPNEGCSWIPGLSKGAFMGTILGVILPSEYTEVFSKYFKDMCSPEKLSDDEEEKWIQRFTRFESIIAYLTEKNTQISIQDELADEAAKLSLPVYALFGEKDELYDLKRQQDFVESIPGAKSELAPEAGHYMPVLNAETCIEFLKKSINS